MYVSRNSELRILITPSDFPGLVMITHRTLLEIIMKLLSMDS